MKEVTIYAVISYGGQYEDKWDNVICSFHKESDAKNYIDKKYALDVITNEEFNKIISDIDNEEERIYEKYYDQETCELLDGASEEDYVKEDTEWYNKKYKYIESQYGYTKEQFEYAYDKYYHDFGGYYIKELKLY